MSSSVIVIEKYGPLSHCLIRKQILENGFKHTKSCLRESWPRKGNTNGLESWTIITVLIGKPLNHYQTKHLFNKSCNICWSTSVEPPCPTQFSPLHTVSVIYKSRFWDDTHFPPPPPQSLLKYFLCIKEICS